MLYRGIAIIGIFLHKLLVNTIQFPVHYYQKELKNIFTLLLGIEPTISELRLIISYQSISDIFPAGLLNPN